MVGKTMSNKVLLLPFSWEKENMIKRNLGILAKKCHFL
jgi:hypothetical protein